ncbi:MAG: AAA family ATPase [Nanoarchaeota archaeon]|nr:AAA family ATPase [Nanoarchaeota archaeon]
MERVALIIGVSCCGKDYYLDKIGRFLDARVRVVNFGKEVFNCLRLTHPQLTHRDQLRNLDFGEVYEGIKKVSRWVVENQPIVVNTHMVIQARGSFVIIPESVYCMSPEILIHVSAPAEEIVRRRECNKRNRKEVAETTREVSLHQDLSAWVTKRFAQELEATLIEIENRSGEDETNLQILKEALSGFH